MAVVGAGEVGVGAPPEEEAGAGREGWHKKADALKDDDGGHDALAAVRLRGQLCPICLDQFHPGELARRLEECGHVYHMACLDEALARRMECPTCRQDPLETVTRRRARVPFGPRCSVLESQSCFVVDAGAGPRGAGPARKKPKTQAQP